MDFSQQMQTLETEHTQHRADGAFDKAAEVRARQVELLIAHNLLREAADYSVWAGNEWMHHVRMLRQGRRIPEADTSHAKAVAAYARALELDPTHPQSGEWKDTMERAAGER